MRVTVDVCCAVLRCAGLRMDYALYVSCVWVLGELFELHLLARGACTGCCAVLQHHMRACTVQARMCGQVRGVLLPGELARHVQQSWCKRVLRECYRPSQALQESV